MSIPANLQRVIDEASGRLLSRASESRGLDLETIMPRIVSSVEKYLFRGEENASAADIAKFVDEMHADDLCLIIACERGDERAWEDLVARYDSTVKSAA